MNKAALFISIVAFILSAVWLYFERDFEPLISTVLCLGGVLGSWTYGRKSQRDNQYLREFDAIKARWLAERELRQPNLDDARWLLSEVLDFLHRLRVEPNTDKYHAEIDKLTLSVKTTQNMQIYLDGGASYSEFWHQGTEAIEKISGITSKI
ncbi:hypothetical protein [Celerinatantimonas sp. MCCC 1A17872]|uniref:hypothetical protein n=1 Tax=Celerinatantimonas sp. MCCC 1A17872 TaxID=3177514 RepID=UPI0038C6E171